jgi:hypothetical protein
MFKFSDTLFESLVVHPQMTEMRTVKSTAAASANIGCVRKRLRRTCLHESEPVCGELLILGKSVIRHTQVSPTGDRRDELWRDSALTRGLESPAAAAKETHELDAVDFVSEERPQNGHMALSLSRRTRRRRGASLRDRTERSAD